MLINPKDQLKHKPFSLFKGLEKQLYGDGVLINIALLSKIINKNLKQLSISRTNSQRMRNR